MFVPVRSQAGDPLAFPSLARWCMYVGAAGQGGGPEDVLEVVPGPCLSLPVPAGRYPFQPQEESSADPLCSFPYSSGRR